MKLLPGPESGSKPPCPLRHCVLDGVFGIRKHKKAAEDCSPAALVVEQKDRNYAVRVDSVLSVPAIAACAAARRAIGTRYGEQDT